ncbi:MAG TPA: peptidylprolyl isomerase [Rhizomicrobium sp.]|nr:peptidylprolyl isomerase [Rhizomicrobium sp.]
MLRPILLAAALVVAVPAAAQTVKIETSLGTITLALDAQHAPASVNNFVRYVKGGHYDKTVFYRVAPGFVIQAGSFDAEGNARSTKAPIKLESGNGLVNVRGAVAMARSGDPDSATAEFFIDLADNAALDAHPGDAPGTTGYAVFGHVSDGMDVVDKIAAVPLGGTKSPFPPDAAPATPVVITKMTVIGDAPSAAK